jgi:hypothetical protein
MLSELRKTHASERLRRRAFSERLAPAREAIADPELKI